MEKYCKSCGRVFKDSNFKLCPYCGNQLSTRVGRQPIPRKLRHQVFQRDNYRCRECGATNKETTLEIDHIVPVAKGGSNNLSNLQTLCKACNRAKHTRTWVGGSSKSYKNPIREENDLYVVETYLGNNDNVISKYYKKSNLEYGGHDFYKNKDIFNEYNTPKEFMDALTTEGVELNCLIPYYGYGPSGNIEIRYPNPIERFKNVRLLDDGIYIDNVVYDKTLRMLWNKIVGIDYRNNSLLISLRDGNDIIIYLPNKFNLYEDIKMKISDKTQIWYFPNKTENKHHDDSKGFINKINKWLKK